MSEQIYIAARGDRAVEKALNPFKARKARKLASRKRMEDLQAATRQSRMAAERNLSAGYAQSERARSMADQRLIRSTRNF